ncbi:MAG: M23 family metallopeptidase [Pseudomonadota bacterium]
MSLRAPLQFVTLLAIIGLSLNAAATQCLDTDENLCIYAKARGSDQALIAINRTSRDITVELKVELSNMQVQTPAQMLNVVPPHSEEVVAILEIINQYQSSSYKYAYQYIAGDVYAEHDDSVLYQLPYGVGETFYVGQSCNTNRTHSSDFSRYAIDFDLPVGTPIYAARDGKVVDQYRLSNSGGLSEMHLDKGNYIEIEHSDGTIANYHHLRMLGVKVQIGDEVATGDFIGYSGNTGYSSGPHLHFAVTRPISSSAAISIPVKWQAARGVLTCPREGLALRATPIDG